jgi:hypothetical protein
MWLKGSLTRCLKLFVPFENFKVVDEGMFWGSAALPGYLLINSFKAKK